MEVNRVGLTFAGRSTYRVGANGLTADWVTPISVRSPCLRLSGYAFAAWWNFTPSETKRVQAELKVIFTYQLRRKLTFVVRKCWCLGGWPNATSLQS